jgi:hypothetical protein
MSNCLFIQSSWSSQLPLAFALGQQKESFEVKWQQLAWVVHWADAASRGFMLHHP